MNAVAKQSNEYLFRGARKTLLLIFVLVLSGCAVFSSSKPVLPLQDGLTVYRTEHSPARTVLLVPGCGGINTNGSSEFYSRVARQLNANGFNAIILDYVKLMGQKNACLGQIKFEAVLALINSALAYTAQQPFVDPQHISLLGWSLGGSGVLTVASKSTQPSISAVAAYYPGCYDGLQFSMHPTLLMLGLADNVVNPQDCIALARQFPQAPLTIKTYPGAHHGFDVDELQPAQQMHFFWKTFTAEYQQQASEDAMQVLLNFLKENG